MKTIILILTLCLIPVTAYAVTQDQILSNKDFQTVQFKQEGKSYEVSAEYPQFFQGRLVGEDLLRVNKEVKSFVRKVMLDADRDGLFGSVVSGEEDHRKAEGKTTEDITFKVIQANAKFVSIKFERYHYVEGGAHGLTVISTFNYDVGGRKVIQLSDLFKPDQTYLDDVSKICIKDLISQVGMVTEDWTKEGAAAKEKDLGVFALSERDLIIYFQPYQITSYSGGNPEVHIPFKNLRSILKEGVFRFRESRGSEI